MSSIARYVARSPPRARGELEADIVVVIPAYREVADLGLVLQSLPLDDPDVACVVVVNNETDATPEVLAENAETALLAESFGAHVLDYWSAGCAFRPGRGGVGAARRVGMDWVVAASKRADVAIASLDADSPVDSDYIAAVRSFRQSGAAAGLADFRHPLPDGAHGDAIAQYETWLRYWVEALRAARSPYAYPTLGSTIVCTVGAYVAAAGMPRRTAGEDFYFVQKLHKTSGPLVEIGAIVHPSARLSDRVPFGTGPALRNHLAGDADYSLVESPASFNALAQLLSRVDRLRTGDDALGELAPELLAFLEDLEVGVVLPRLRQQHRTEAAFARAFAGWFDGLRTRQLVRRLSQESQVPLREAVHTLCGIDEHDPRVRLERMRGRW